MVAAVRPVASPSSAAARALPRDARRAAGPLVALLLLSCAAPGGAAAPLRPMWDCLPDACVLAVRVPDGRGLAEALRDDTRLGAVLTGDGGRAALHEVLATFGVEPGPSPGEGPAAAERPGSSGLTSADVPRLLAGASGFALTIDRRPEAPPLLVALGWTEPGPDLAGRTWDAIGRAADDHAEDVHPVGRVNLLLDGRPVMHLTRPMVTLEPLGAAFELPDDFDQMDEAQQQQALERAAAADRPAFREGVTYTHLLLTRIECRLLLVAALRRTATPDPAPAERLIGVLARLIRAHGTKAPGFTARIGQATEGATSRHGAGRMVLEAHADLAPVIGMLAERPGGADAVAALGIGGVGAAVLRCELVGSALHANGFIAAPAPRVGGLAGLDRVALTPRVPAHIRADLAGHAHLGARLGAIHAAIREALVHVFGAAFEPRLQLIEGMALAMTQTDMAATLDALGHRHTLLLFESDPAAGPGDAALPWVPPGSRFAMVWRPEDDAVWAHLMQTIASLAPMVPGGLQPFQEGGFSGWRLSQGAFRAGLALGGGHLVLAVGSGVLERTLATLEQPAAAQQRDGAVIAPGPAPSDPEPGIAFLHLDGPRFAATLRHALDLILARRAHEAASLGLATDRLERWRHLLPTEAEVDGLLGPTTGVMRFTDEGLVVDVVSELGKR